MLGLSRTIVALDIREYDNAYLKINMQLIKDAWAYDLLAKNILEKGVFGLGGLQPSAWFMPLYPAFVASIYGLFGYSPEVVVIFQHLLVLINLILIYKIAESIKKGVGRYAVVLAFFYLPFYYAANQIVSESLFNTLLLVFVFRWLRQKTELKIFPLFLDGVVLAMGVLIRPVIFFAALGLSAIELLQRRWMKMLIVGIGFVLMMLPWWTRNLLVFERFVPFSLQSGEVLLGGTYVDYDFEPEKWPTGTTETEINDRRQLLAMTRISQDLKTNPVGWLFWQVKKIWLLWSAPYYNQYGVMPIYRVAYTYHWALLIFGIIGSVIFRKNLAVVKLVAIIVSISLVQILTVGLDRYNLPMMYPVILMAALVIEKIVWKKNGVRNKTYI